MFTRPIIKCPYWPRIKDLLTQHENLIIDTGGHHNVPGWIPLVEQFGPEKFCFGSESPWNHPALVIKNIWNRKLKQNSRELILGRNAERLFKELI